MAGKEVMKNAHEIAILSTVSHPNIVQVPCCEGAVYFCGGKVGRVGVSVVHICDRICHVSVAST